MGTFKREGGFNDRKGSRDFKPGGRGGFGPSRGSFGRGGDRGEKQMYKAICSECRRSCEVPFRPTGDKPVYCSNCFSAQNEVGGGRSFDKPRFEERKNFNAVCDKCGKQCDLPFRPTPGKPVFCNACFAKPEGRGGNAGGCKNCDCQENYKNLSAKLDKIMKALNIPNEVVKTASVKAESVKEAFGDLEDLEGGESKKKTVKAKKTKEVKEKKLKTVKKVATKTKEAKTKSTRGGVNKAAVKKAK